MKCLKCNWEGSPNLVEVGPHTKAICQECGAYIKFVGKEELDEIIKNTISQEDVEEVRKPKVLSKSMMRRLKIQKGDDEPPF